MKKVWLIIIVLLVGGGYGYYKYRNKAAATTDAAPEGPKKTAKAEVGTINLRVSTTGRVVANLDVDIKSKASGQIIRLPYDISDSVTSGALLAELDPVDENRNVTQKEAALQSAKARLAQAKEQVRISSISLDTGTSSALADYRNAEFKYRDSKSRLARAEELFAKSLVSKEELDAARTDEASAANALRQAEVKVQDSNALPRTLEIRKQDIVLQESSVVQAEMDLQNARQRLKETRIIAPMDGVITSRPVQQGMIIASGTNNVGGGTTLMTLSDLSRIFVSANVDESDIGKVKLDQRATITADAFPGKRFRGKVVRVSTKGVTSQNVTTFEVKIEIEGEGKELLRPEMSGNVEIQADRHEDVIVIANEAVQFGKEGYFVEMPDGAPDKTKRVPVKTGLTDGVNTEIVEGLKEGDEVNIPASVLSRWARGGQQGGAGGFSRGMQMGAFRMSGAGGGGGGGRGR
ncbi:MAG: efflux RND transporter periplasmic adaptor subunit [Candidatus Sumerlaeaceae bacterium]|nr:efflux RND transporter periplasmic adaptor subunit [Candidatus Sumerlaeaceae bacterium]